MDEKPLYFVGPALSDLRDFPDDARRMAGHQLHLVQLGLEPDDWKPMATVGKGAAEIRVHTELEHRVFYVAKFPEAIYVLHAFAKTTRQTSKADVEAGRSAYATVMAARRERAAAERKRRK